MAVCRSRSSMSYLTVLRLVLLVVSTGTSPCDGSSLRRGQLRDIDENQAEVDAGSVLIGWDQRDMRGGNEKQILRVLKKEHAEKDGGGEVTKDQWRMMGCDRGGGDNQNMNFFDRNFGSCSTADPCLAAAMPIQMAYYCPKYFRPYCGGRCVSPLNGQCTDGIVRDKRGRRHNFLKDRKFWDREVSAFGYGTNKPFWPYNFGGKSCAYDYSAAFSSAQETPMPTPRPTTLRTTPAPTPSPEFVLTEEQLRNCQFLALLGRTSTLGLENVCNTSPDARLTCPQTCHGRCDPFPSLHDITVQSTSCQLEANRMYINTEEVVKDCEWLSGQGNKGAICDESNQRALKACPRECIENNAEYNWNKTGADDEVKDVADERSTDGTEGSNEHDEELEIIDSETERNDEGR